MPTKTERIETELAAVRAALTEGRGSDLPDIIHAAVERTLALPQLPGKGGNFDLGDWTPLLAELRYFERWRPAEKGGDPAQVEREVDPVPIVKAYAEALAERGVDLLMVLVPTRVQVYPDRLPGVPEIEKYGGHDLGYLQLLVDLLEAGVEVVDLLPHFFTRRFDDSGENDRLLYQDFDSHWTPRGAALCAEVLAQRIRQFDWFEPGPCQEGVDFVVRREPEVVRYRQTPSSEERTATLWYERVLDLEDRPVVATGDETPILILGDSFSTVFSDPQSSDLVRLIYARLGWKLDAILVPGGAASSVWSALARRSEGVGNRHLVLWIVSARAIGSGRMKAVDLFGNG